MTFRTLVRTLAAAACLVLVPALAAEAAKPVIDHSNLRVNRQVQNIVQQQQRDIKVILRNLDALRQGHGDAGTLLALVQTGMQLMQDGKASLAGAARDLRSMAAPDFKQLLKQQAAPGVAALEAEAGLADLSAAPQDFRTIAGARDFIKTALEPPVRNSSAALLLKDRRHGVYKEAVDTSFALALHNRQTAAQAPEQLQKLASAASQAKTTRDQQAVQAALTVMLIEEVASLRGMFAAYLNMEAARSHRDRGVIYAGDE